MAKYWTTKAVCFAEDGTSTDESIGVTYRGPMEPGGSSGRPVCDGPA
jgi:hypothetical protein